MPLLIFFFLKTEVHNIKPYQHDNIQRISINNFVHKYNVWSNGLKYNVIHLYVNIAFDFTVLIQIIMVSLIYTDRKIYYLKSTI